MTTIVGVVEDGGRITLYADSQSTSGYTRVDKGCGKHRSKLFAGADMAVACTGLVVESTFLEMYAANHGIGDGGSLRVAEWLAEFAVWMKKSTGEYKVENSYIIAHRSGLFSCEGIGVIPAEKWAANGSGRDFALAALHLGNSGHDAVSVACELDVFSNGPVNQRVVEGSK